MSRSVDWERAVSVFERHEEVIAAWAFGSAQDGVVPPEGDLDVAVLWRENPTLAQLAALSADLQEALHFDEIDLLVLNRAHVIARFEAVSGRALFCRDLAARAEFVSLTAREYEDTMAFIRRGLESYMP